MIGKNFLTAIILLSTSAWNAGCAVTEEEPLIIQAGVRERISNVAILPFENIAEKLDAGRRVTSVFLTKLYKTGKVRIVEQGEVERFLRDNRIRRTGEIDFETTERICAKLGVQAVILGTVAEYNFVDGPDGRIPVVSVSLRIVDRNGNIVLALSRVKEGDENETVFGIGRITSIIKLSSVLVDELIEKVVEFLEQHNEDSGPESQPPGETGKEEPTGASKQIEKRPAGKTGQEPLEEKKSQGKAEKTTPTEKERKAAVKSGESPVISEEDKAGMKDDVRRKSKSAWDRIKKGYENK